ncbi:MAG: hypothetical protein WDN72_09000 [Alphaproteobacteria bacterium]
MSWNPVEKLLHPSAPVAAPVRKPSMNLAHLAPGSVLHFSRDCPLPPLSGARASIAAVRTYCFGTDITVSYQLDVAGAVLFLTIAEDAQGYYLAVSRALAPPEQDAFFGRDALGFFTEASSAKTIRCKADPVVEGAWTAPRYSKTVDWAAGTLTQGRLSTAGLRQTRQFHYNLLVDESGEKALEIEHDDDTGENRILLTVYRPAEDIASLAEPVPHIPAPQAPSRDEPVAAPAIVNGHAPEEAEQERSQRTDFRRMPEGESIHIGRSPRAERPGTLPAELPPLPSFLLSREKSYLSLDEIITPESERVRCDLPSARLLIELALKRRLHVRDVLRELIGLDSATRDEVIFELPLTEEDYRALAMRYRLKPDHRGEIRDRLQDELRQKLAMVAKG